jgi:hypothetical protein
MSRTNRICVEITGGLGNQLFQLNAALSLRNEPGEEVLLDWNLGRPRLNPRGLPDLFDFELPYFVKFNRKKRMNWLPRKTFGYLLRMGYSPRTWEKLKPINLVIKRIGGLILFIYFRTKRSPIVSRDLGYSRLENVSKKFILVGYFQSYKYLEVMDNHELLRGLKPRVESEFVNKLRIEAETDSPLIVHFRFGDYLNESDFGIPDKNYYLNAIRLQWNLGVYRKIWVYSDDLGMARKYFPREYIQYVRWIEPIENSSVLNLESMRFGKGYVIANSTFSYWAAILSYGKPVKVIAPSPWFKSTSSPKELIPKNWTLLQAWSVEKEVRI